MRHSLTYVQPTYLLKTKHTNEMTTMKTNPTSRSAFFNPRVLIGFVLCSIGVLLTLAALSKSADQTPVAMATAQTPGTCTATVNMNTARYLHTATLLNNGKILVTGGVDASGAP